MYIYIYIIYINLIERVFGVQYNMSDTTSFMLGNLQSIFLPTKTKRFHKYCKRTYRKNKHTPRSIIAIILYSV